MGKITKRYESFQRALKMLDKSIENFKITIDYADQFTQTPLHFSDIFLAQRESMIQRFEYCVDLYWKYLKDYLESEIKIVPTPAGPKNIIRESTRYSLLSESESELSLKMINDRNQSSHIYREEIAEHIAVEIPHYYTLMTTIVSTLKPTENR